MSTPIHQDDEPRSAGAHQAIRLAARTLLWLLLIHWAHRASPAPLAVFVEAGVLGDMTALAMLGLVSLPKHVFSGSIHAALGVGFLVYAVDLAPLATLMDNPESTALAFVGFMLVALMRGVRVLVRYFAH